MGSLNLITPITTMSKPMAPVVVPALHDGELAHDITSLLSLSATTLSFLTNSAPPSRPQSALSTLDSYKPSSSNLDDSQRLINSYITDMRGEVLKMDKREDDA